jgi:23S rRNA (guanosine2251-2'-O)-methyltransferase
MKIEGRNAVTELLKTDKNIEKIIIDEGLSDEGAKRLIREIKAKKIKVQSLSRLALDKESESGRHQGFIAYSTDFKYSEIEDIINSNENGESFIVILDGIEDPHNLGSIIRVCECGGVDGIIIAKDRQVQVNDTVMRVSEGAANHIKIAKVVNINNAIDELKKHNIWVYGAELGGSDIYKTNLKGNIALVIGGEDSGIKRLTKEKCDGIITIPMLGKVNSLNASVACGVVVFETLRQRLK